MSPTPTPAVYAYTSQPSSSIVTRCTAPTALAGSFDPSSCINANATGLNKQRGFTFDADATRAYMVNNDGDSVTLCDVQDFIFTNCRNSGATELSIPRAITFFNGYALIANQFSLVTKCSVNAADGSLSLCTSAGGSLYSQPWSIQATTEYGGDYVYIASRENGNVVKCNLGADATLSLCVSYSVPNGGNNLNFAYLTGSLIYAVRGGSNGNPAVLRADVSAIDGSLSSFTDTGATNLGTGSNGTIVGFTIRSGYGYITKLQLEPSIIKCTVQAGGDLAGCIDSGAAAPGGYMTLFLPLD
jgi:hypothetical protein